MTVSVLSRKDGPALPSVAGRNDVGAETRLREWPQIKRRLKIDEVVVQIRLMDG